MNFAFKLMKFAIIMANVVLKMIRFVLQMTATPELTRKHGQPTLEEGSGGAAAKAKM